MSHMQSLAPFLGGVGEDVLRGVIQGPLMLWEKQWEDLAKL